MSPVDHKAIAVKRDVTCWGVVRQGRVVCEDVQQTREIRLERIWGTPNSQREIAEAGVSEDISRRSSEVL